MTGIQAEEKFSIGGIKFTENIALLSITEPIDKADTAPLFFRFLSENEINIFMLSRVMDDKAVRTDCTVSEDDLDNIYKLIFSNREKSGFSKKPDFLILAKMRKPEIKERLKVLHGLGAISVYPHKSRMKLLGKILFAFGNRKIPVYNMTSSISSFTFLTDCNCLNKAAEALEENFRLPENHAPFEKQFCIKHVHKNPR